MRTEYSPVDYDHDHAHIQTAEANVGMSPNQVWRGVVLVEGRHVENVAHHSEAHPPGVDAQTMKLVYRVGRAASSTALKKILVFEEP